LTADCWEQSDIFNIDVHHISYKFKVNEKPRRIIFWDKSSKLRSGVIQKFLYWPCEIGRITIRYSECPKSNDNVVIWLPSMKLPKNQKDRYEAILNDYILKASAWLQRVLLCRLSLLEVYRKPHYSVPVREPELKTFAKIGNLKVDDTWIDSSPPSREPCFESSNFNKAICYLELPNRVINLESRMNRIETNLDRIAVSVDRLLNIFESPSKPDEKRDVV
jgi:hypothetical protein